MLYSLFIDFYVDTILLEVLITVYPQTFSFGTLPLFHPYCANSLCQSAILGPYVHLPGWSKLSTFALGRRIEEHASSDKCLYLMHVHYFNKLYLLLTFLTFFLELEMSHHSIILSLLLFCNTFLYCVFVVFFCFYLKLSSQKRIFIGSSSFICLLRLSASYD